MPSKLENELIVARIEDFSCLQSFVCGNAQMDTFIHEQFEDCCRAHFCVPYLVCKANGNDIVALFALSNDSIDLDRDDFDDMRVGAVSTRLPEMKEAYREQFERKYTYPALEITYLAVSETYQQQHLGSDLLEYIVSIARAQTLAGCIFLTVKALHTKEYSAKAFYEKNGFALQTPVPTQDVWPMYRTIWEVEQD